MSPTTGQSGLAAIPESQRLAALPPYTVWLMRVAKQVSQKIEQGYDIINIGIGDPDIPTAPRVVAAGQAAAADPANHRYPDMRGVPAFREAMAARYERKFGVTLDPRTEVMASTGSQESLFNIALGFTNPGDITLAGDPGYPMHFAGPQLAGAHSLPVPLLAERGWAPDLAGIDDETADAARLLYLCYPNNPTGALVPDGAFEEAVDFARRHDVLIVHDFAYAEIALDGQQVRSILDVPGARDVAVELYSMTKGFSMAGWRLGAVLGHSELLDRYFDIKLQVDSGTFQAVQMAGVAALAPEGDEELAQRLDIYRARRELVCDALEAGGIPVQRPVATPYVWSPVPHGFEDCETFAQYVLNEIGVAISPGWAFGQGGVGNFRISLMAPDELLAEAAERLASLTMP